MLRADGCAERRLPACGYGNGNRALTAPAARFVRQDADGPGFVWRIIQNDPDLCGRNWFCV